MLGHSKPQHSEHLSPLRRTPLPSSPHSLELHGWPATLEDTKPDDSVSRVRIVVISDLNSSYGSTAYNPVVYNAVKKIIEWKPDLVLITGDMVAGQRHGLDYLAMWTAFHNTVTHPIRDVSIPVAVTPGNHDASAYKAYAVEREIFIDQWKAHRPALEYVDESQYPLYYSFKMGQAFFIALDATMKGALGNEQRTWVKQQLEVAASYPIKIVFGHVPLFPFATGRETEILNDPQLEALFESHHVSLIFNGHHQVYYPGRVRSLNVVSVPCAGLGPRTWIGQDHTSPRGIVSFELVDSDIHNLEAWRAPDFTQVIERASLPTRIEHEAWSIHRDDLAPMK